MGNELIYNWSFSNDKNRGSLWYMITLAIVIGFVVWGFLSKQYFLSFLVILITGVYFFVENNFEENTNVYITNLGIRVSSSFYDFSKINSFSLIYDGENAIILRLFLIKNGLKILDLHINNDIAINLKEILPSFLEENENGDLTFVDRLIRLLKL